MKFFAALLISLVSGAHFMSVCNPKTKVGMCASRDGVTKKCNWNFAAAVHGQRVDMTAADDKVARICGPGKFNFAPNTCGHEGADESRHAYKAETFECTTKEDCECREVSLNHFAQCYSVDCA